MGNFTKLPIPFNPGDRVRVARYDMTDEDGQDLTGLVGEFKGVWKDGSGCDCPDVTYPCSVQIDNFVGLRHFKVDELERDEDVTDCSK